jgi:hypothetical protein
MQESFSNIFLQNHEATEIPGTVIRVDFYSTEFGNVSVLVKSNSS